MKFTTYLNDKIATQLERKGTYLVDSEFRGVMYVIKDGTIAIMGGKNGNLSVGIDEASDFIKELTEILELAKDRRCMKIKGA